MPSPQTRLADPPCDTAVGTGAIMLATLVEVTNGEYRFQLTGTGQVLSPVASMCPLEPKQLGQSFAIGFDGGDFSRPLVLGPVHQMDQTGSSVPLILRSDSEVRLECGKATVKLTSDGTVRIRGENVASRASHTNRIRGGNVQIN